MNRFFASTSVLLLVSAVAIGFVFGRQSNRSLRGWASAEAKVEVFFSPGGGCLQAITEEIDKAKDEIAIQAYSFTSKPIGMALERAMQRGIRVRIIVDKGAISDKYCIGEWMAHAGADVRADAKHAISHNKVMVIDNNVVITGSYNFTAAAETRNAENMVIIRDKTFARTYMDNWYKHESHSERIRP